MSKNEQVDEQINELIEKVKSLKTEVEQNTEIANQKWLTNCLYSGVELDEDKSNYVNGMRTVKGVNIQTSNKEKLLSILAEMIRFRNSYATANELLNSNFLKMNETEKDAFVISGFPFSQWVADFKKRIAIIEQKDKKEQLETVEKMLNTIVSPEQKRLKTLQEAQEKLSKL